MDPILYNAAGGGFANFKRQEVIANNLANVATPGFKTDMYQAQTMYVQGAAASNNLGQSFIVQNNNGFDFSPGSFTTTGRSLDIAIDGNGWIAVRNGAGKEAYTKAGALNINANGQLTTASGKLVIGSGGPITIPPATSVTIGTDGTISVVPQGSDPKSAMVVDRIKMVTLNKNNVVKDSEGLFELKNGGVAPVDTNLKLVSGTLEGSNVQPVEQMVAMINAGRDFETHMNVLTTMNNNTQRLAQMLQD